MVLKMLRANNIHFSGKISAKTVNTHHILSDVKHSRLFTPSNKKEFVVLMPLLLTLIMCLMISLIILIVLYKSHVLHSLRNSTKLSTLLITNITVASLVTLSFTVYLYVVHNPTENNTDTVYSYNTTGNNLTGNKIATVKSEDDSQNSDYNICYNDFIELYSNCGLANSMKIFLLKQDDMSVHKEQYQPSLFQEQPIVPTSTPVATCYSDKELIVMIQGMEATKLYKLLLVNHSFTNRMEEVTSITNDELLAQAYKGRSYRINSEVFDTVVSMLQFSHTRDVIELLPIYDAIADLNFQSTREQEPLEQEALLFNIVNIFIQEFKQHFIDLYNNCTHIDGSTFCNNIRYRISCFGDAINQAQYSKLITISNNLLTLLVLFDVLLITKQVVLVGVEDDTGYHPDVIITETN